MEVGAVFHTQCNRGDVNNEGSMVNREYGDPNISESLLLVNAKSF